jgi:hypothetical protein
VKRVHLVALIAGLAVDVIGTLIAFVAVNLVFFALRSANSQWSPSTFQAIDKDPLFLVIGYITGMGSTFLGAYIVARMSRPHSVLNTLLFGIISTLLIVSFGPNPHWYNVLGALAIIPVSLVPGYLLAGRRSNQSLQPTVDRSDV